MSKSCIFSKINYQNGQALLIVVLIMVVALTVGLSIASKSITSLRNSSYQASSQKALFAAEAGIEQALKSNSTDNIIAEGFTNIYQGTEYKTDVFIVRGNDFLLNGGNPVLQNSGIDLWLTDYSSESAELYKIPYSGSTFSVYWGSDFTACNNAAMEVVVITGTKITPLISKYVYDPCESRRSGNNFSACSSDGSQRCTFATVNAGGKTFYYKANIPAASGLVARVVPLYMSTVVGITASVDSPLPSQGKVISSIGKSGSTERQVNVFQGYSELPIEYFYNLFLP